MATPDDPPPNKRPPDLSPFAEEWLRGKTAQDFEIFEHLGRIHWPIKISRRRRGPDGKPVFAEEPALLRVLDTRERLRAIDAATKYFDEQGLKIADPRHQAIWAEVERHAHVALALREALQGDGKPYPENVEPHPKATLADLMEHAKSGISAAEVSRLYDLMQTFEGFEGAKLEKVDKELAIRVALAIAEVGNLSPLVAIAGPAQDSSVVYLMQILSDFLRGEPSSPLPASSTPAPSPSPSSS